MRNWADPTPGCDVSAGWPATEATGGPKPGTWWRVRRWSAKPWLLGWLGIAAIVTWAAPQSWDWTSRITAPRAVAMLGLFWASLLLLTTQSFNPFIYFIF